VAKKKKELIPLDLAEEVVEGVLKHRKKDSKLAKFYLLWFLGIPSKPAAKLAGYSESYGRALITRYSKDAKLRGEIDNIVNVMPERYKAITKLRLIEIASIEAQALQQYKDDPGLAIKKPQLLKHMKQSAKVLEPDTMPSPQVINVGSIKVLQTILAEDLGIADVIDAKVEEVKQIEGSSSDKD
jgi:hypothetical protein